MAAGTYNDALKHVFYHEGGYSNDPGDSGGPTNWGITIHDARMYWKANATAADVRAMPQSVATEIYRKHYADPIMYDRLPAGVDYAVLDYGINSGVGRAVRVLQRLVGVPVDGKVGLVTLTAARAANPGNLVNAICAERLRFLQGLSIWPIFGKGWGRRVGEVRRWASSMVGTTQPSPLPPVVPNTMPAPRQNPSQVEASAKGYPPEPRIKPLVKSRTLWGAAATALGSLGTAISGGMQWITTPLGFAAFVLTLALCGVGLWMVVSGRLNAQKLLEHFKDEVDGDPMAPVVSAEEAIPTGVP